MTHVLLEPAQRERQPSLGIGTELWRNIWIRIVDTDFYRVLHWVGLRLGLEQTPIRPKDWRAKENSRNTPCGVGTV